MLKVITVAILLCSISIPHAARSQEVGEIAVGSTVSGVFNSIADDLRGLIEQTEDSANVVAMKSRVQAAILLQNLSLLGSQFSDTMFKNLAEAEQQLFIDAQQLVEQWNSGNEESLRKLQELNQGFAATLSVIPGSKTEPRVIDYDPPYVVSDPERVHRVSISGQFLGSGDPVLIFEGVHCKRIGKLETKLEFECPNAMLSHYERMSPIVGSLLVYREKSFFEWLGSLFGDNSELMRSYEIALTAVPGNVGQYATTAYVSTDVIDRKNRSISFYHRNDHCTYPRTLTWSAVPQKDYEVDIQSARYQITTQSSNSTLNNFNPTSSAISVVARVANNGACGPIIPFTNQRAGVDARGAFGITVIWDDIKKTTKEIPSDAGQGFILWGQDHAVLLPDGTKSFLVSIEHPTGEITSIDRAGDYKWLSVRKNGPNLIFKPKEPSVIFGE